MKPDIWIIAYNIHTGGGAVLLNELLGSIPQEDASRFADLVLTPLVDHQVENKISDEEALKWHERIAQLKDSEVGLKRWHIHQSILALFSAMEKRAEVEMGRDLDGPIFHPVHLK